MIAAKQPGSEVKLEVWRDGSVKRITARPVEIDEKGARVAGRSSDEGDTNSRLGLAVRPLAPEEKRQADTEGSLVVENVTGPAAAAGIQPGDIILGVNGERVKSLNDLKSATGKSSKVVALLVQRDDAQIFVPVRLS
jgi:serine protease Do